MITISLFVAILITLSVLAYLLYEDHKFNKNVTVQEESNAALQALIGINKTK